MTKAWLHGWCNEAYARRRGRWTRRGRGWAIYATLEHVDFLLAAAARWGGVLSCGPWRGLDRDSTANSISRRAAGGHHPVVRAAALWLVSKGRGGAVLEQVRENDVTVWATRRPSLVDPGAFVSITVRSKLEWLAAMRRNAG